MVKFQGLEACKQAFERLLSGAPLLPIHTGVEPIEITAAMVSVEAGFDKGYLKRSRDAHKPLIARIEALKGSKFEQGKNAKSKLKKAALNVQQLRSELNSAKENLDRVLTQNLMLIERIRELEAKVSSHKLATIPIQ